MRAWLLQIWAFAVEFYRKHRHDWDNPNHYTLMILPHDATGVKKIKLSSNWFKTIILVTVVFWVSALFMFFSYFHLQNKTTRLTHVEKENIEQRIQLETLNTKMQFLETQLARLQNIDLKVRELVNLDVKGSGVKFAGGSDNLKGDNIAKQMLEKADALEKEIKNTEKNLSELVEFLEDKKSLFMATPSLWPCRGFITSEFGWRRDPLVSVSEFHEGIDISSPLGTQVKAPAEGTVIFAGLDGGYGKVVVIDHGYGIVTRYAHLARYYVTAGQKISKGKGIAAVGNSGKSTGPHLHYEVRLDGVPVNPLKYLFSS